MSVENVAETYLLAERFARNHYENFPVVSLLIPKELRKHVAIIYWFARTADDLADEGDYSESERLDRLNNFEQVFAVSLNGDMNHKFFPALVNSITEKKLTQQYFYDLLSAFKQDITKKRYSNFEEVLNYCSRSANPVGRLILELFGINTKNAIKHSDCICTALQLTNFLQDTPIDYKKGRIYLPLDEMENFSVEEKLFEQNENNDNLKMLVQHNVNRVQDFFDEGKKLLPLLKGRLKYEIGWTVNGGEEILEQIRNNNYNVLGFRPKLGKLEMFKMFIKTFRYL